MQKRAYILFRVEAGQSREVIAAIKNISGVVTVDTVTGPYDLIVTVEADDERELGRIIRTEIFGIPAVKQTQTCLVI